MRWGQVDRVARAIPHGACPLVARRVSRAGNRTACACARPTLTKLATLVAFVQSKTMSTQTTMVAHGTNLRGFASGIRAQNLTGSGSGRQPRTIRSGGLLGGLLRPNGKEIFMSMLEQWIIKDEYGVDVEAAWAGANFLAKPKDESGSESEGEGADVDVARVLRLSPQKAPRISKNLISKKGRSS